MTFILNLFAFMSALFLTIMGIYWLLLAGHAHLKYPATDDNRNDVLTAFITGIFALAFGSALLHISFLYFN